MALGDFAGPAYLRYSFTRGTEREVSILVDALGLRPGHRVLDLGCGPGRHAHALARRGIEVVGVDISQRFVAEAMAGAPPGATFVHADALDLEYDAGFDAVVSLCQGAFGTESREVDARLVAVIARALRPGGRLALGAVSAEFVASHQEDGEDFDAAAGLYRERATVRDDRGRERAFDLVTVCYRLDELGALLEAHALGVLESHHAQHELLVIAAKKPGDTLMP